MDTTLAFTLLIAAGSLLAGLLGVLAGSMLGARVLIRARVGALRLVFSVVSWRWRWR